MKKLMFVLALALGFGSGAFADGVDIDKMKLQLGSEGFTMDLYTSGGLLVGEAKVNAESWSNNDLTQYVARFKAGTIRLDGEDEFAELVDSFDCAYRQGQNAQDTGFVGIDANGDEFDLSADQLEAAERVGGQFVTGFHGKIEKFDVGSGNEESRLVFRDSNAQFITWASIEANITKGLNRTAAGVWQYEVRWGSDVGPLSGQFINREEISMQLYMNQQGGKKNPDAFTCFSNRPCPALTIRDRNDAGNNGKILTAIAGTYSGGQCYYHATTNTVTPTSDDAGKKIASLTAAQIEEFCE